MSKLNRRSGLLASSSLAALLIGGWAPAAFAAGCAVNDVGVSVGAVSNSSAIDCINIQGSTVNGDVTNTGVGVITPIGSPSQTGILINNSTINGAIVNNGTINASSSGGAAILVDNHAFVSGGMSNSGTISGSVGIVQVSSFSGGISNSGTISVAQEVAVFANFVTSFSGGISNSGTISGAGGVEINQDHTFSGGIDNSGKITANAEGIFVGAGLSSFSGGIINSGTISSGGRGIFVEDFVSNFSGGISNIGTISAASVGIEVGPTSVTTFAGGISNSGMISAGQTGIRVDSVSSFSGGVSNTGTISATNGIVIAGGVTFAPGSAIVNSSTIIGRTAAIDASAATGPVTIDQTGGLISGAVKLSANADVLNMSGGVIAGDIVGAGSSDTINFALGSGTFTYGAAYGFTGVNQVNVNSGTIILDGANSAANVTVNGGALEVGDASNPAATLTLTGSTPLDVVGGVLAGNGAVTGNVAIASGATLNPGGGSTGTLTINGNLAMSSGTVYSVELSPTEASKTQVNGSATLGGATVQANANLQTSGFGSYSGKTYTILSATNALGAGNQFNPTVTFAETSAEKIIVDGAASLSYDANDVYLSLPNYAVELALPSNAPVNAQNVAGAINTFIVGGGTVPSGLQNLASLSGQALNNAANQLAGQTQGSFAPVGFEAGSQFLNLMLDPNVEGRSGFGVAAGAAQAPLGYADQPATGPAAKAISALAPEPRALDPRLSMWASAYGGAGSISGNAATGAASANNQIYGFAAGLDYLAAANTTVGVALGGGGTSWQLGDGMGSGHSGMFQAGVYGTTHNGPAYVSGAAAYSLQDVTTNRTVSLGSSAMQGAFDANVLSARVEGGYRLGYGSLGVTPYGALQTQAMFLPGYAESAGSPFALTYASHTFNATRIEFGAWLDTDSLAALGLRWTTQGLKLYSRLAWAHDFDNEGVSAASFQALPGGGTFLVNSIKPAHDSALVTAGFEYKLADGWSALAKFDGEFSSTTTLVAGTATVRKVW